MTHKLLHEADAHRYTLRIDGELVSVVDYAENGDGVSFTRTYTNPAYRGKGHAAEVTEFAVNDVEAKGGRTIVPMCWYVAEWFDEHPERAGLLASH